MKKDYTSSDAWNNAAIAGLVMAAVTIAAELITALCGKIGGVAGGFVSFIAWAGKMVLCAMMFKWLMTKFHSSYKDVDYPRMQRYGLKLALFSSLIGAAYSVVNLLVINPGALDEILSVMRESYSSMLDSNSEAALEKMLPKMPYYMAIGSFIYYFLWGWLYSTLFSKSIAPDNPFEEDDQETVDNQ